MQSMSTLDSLFLHVENEVSHMHLGAVALFDGPAPSEGELAALVAGKLALLARYRQRVRSVPLGAGPTGVGGGSSFPVGVPPASHGAAQPRRHGAIAPTRRTCHGPAA